MGSISGMNRPQGLRLPEVLDESIEGNHPVRCIDASVATLDLAALGFPQAIPKETGRPADTPGDMLKLSIDGDLKTMRSSRKLAQETSRNVEVRGLLRQLNPDFNTIADLRNDNARALQEVCRELTRCCKTLDCCGQELIAMDGRTFNAVNSQDHHFTESKLKQFLTHIHEQIDTDLNA
jgi:transposase